MKMSNGNLALVLILLVSCSGADLATEFAETSEGGSASLPCNLEPVQPPDKVVNVLWYRDKEETPLYKYDVRGDHPQHWVEPELRDRFFLRLLDGEKALLTISPTHLTDEAVYHCRVDFYQSHSRITHVNLTVVVPPDTIQINDDTGATKNGLTAPYAEGASMTLTCIASGGRPAPKVTWWRDGELVAEETQHFPDRKKAVGVLKIAKLKRSHLLAVYSCEVSNSRVQPPLIVRVAVEMYLRPLEVTLVGENKDLSAGRKQNITCKSKGSRPPAIITWWKDGVSLEGGTVSVSADGNTTQSVLAFTPSASDHGLILTCKASNQRIPFSEQQRTWMLRVLYPPKVTLTLGHGLDPTDIREGADVYFDCHIVANPWVHRVWWLKDGQRLLSNATAGIIVSNQTLVLQGVSRKISGRYCCEATNKQGTSKSPPFHLKIKYEPICGDGVVRKVLGAAKDEPLRIECKVDAEPPASYFRWSFNSTPGIARDLNQFTADQGISVLTYTPKVAVDYGTIQCWGKNALGSQRVPCSYHLVPAGKPDPPVGCGVTNTTHKTVSVSCQKGFDGGLKQRFTLIVSTIEGVVTNISALAPEFIVTNLDPSQEYTAIAYAYNGKGWSKPSDPVTLRTLPAASLREQRRITEIAGGGGSGSESKGHGPWLYILLAAGSTLIVAAAIGAIVFAVRRFRVESPVRERRQRQSPKREETPLNERPPPYTDSAADDKNPDLIPPTNEGLMECSSLVPMAPYTITARPSSKRNSATQMPVKPYHVTWAPILQSRNCATQTPPPHKESSV